MDIAQIIAKQEREIRAIARATMQALTARIQELLRIIEKEGDLTGDVYVISSMGRSFVSCDYQTEDHNDHERIQRTDDNEVLDYVDDGSRIVRFESLVASKVTVRALKEIAIVCTAYEEEPNINLPFKIRAKSVE